ncbi:hypothetical protein C1H76_8564 [Elsinoe australis]|uniref:Uncharacterized protein n=1 Tax=Elsinoe australis TaxID=40998 RepID=A0A4U7AMT4_9PEZI|nr:hypothetical protein C1H76_8564 [Elsinoe australis]
MEESQAFQSCHFAVPSPCGLYVASLTQQNLYVQYASSLLPAFTFPLDDPSQPKIVAENQSIQWSSSSNYLMMVSTQGVHAYSLQDSTINIHVSNGSASLGKIQAAEILSDGSKAQLMVVWEFGRVNLWDLSTGRATEVGDLKMGGKGNPWALRRCKGRPEVLVLLMRKDAQDVLSFYLPPSPTPFRSITLPTIDVQSIAWSACGQWLSVLDSPLSSKQLQIYSADGFLYRQCPATTHPTPPSTPHKEPQDLCLGYRSAVWSSGLLALSEAQSISFLNTRTFSTKFSLSLNSIRTESRALEDNIVAYQETINAAEQRSYDLLTGQTIPVPIPKSSIIDVRFNRPGSFLSCRDEGNDSALYIIDMTRRRVHSILLQHITLRRAVWHPTRSTLLLVLSDDGTVHIWDVASNSAPLHIPHSYEKRPEAGRIEARWVCSTTSPTPEEDKLAILLTTRKAGFQLLWPQGKPVPSIDQMRASVNGGAEEGDVSEDSLYDILTGRTPLPELKVRQVEMEVDKEETEKLEDTFQEKIGKVDEKVKEAGMQGESLEDDSEIF